MPLISFVHGALLKAAGARAAKLTNRQATALRIAQLSPMQQESHGASHGVAIYLDAADAIPFSMDSASCRGRKSTPIPDHRKLIDEGGCTLLLAPMYCWLYPGHWPEKKKNYGAKNSRFSLIPKGNSPPRVRMYEVTRRG